MRRDDDPVIQAARQVVEALSADAAFIEAVTADEIARRVEVGELIPVERLQVAPGLELVPSGRLRQLEDLLLQLLDEGLTDVLVETVRVTLDLDLEEEPEAGPPAPDEPATPAEEAPAEEAAPSGAPERLRLPTEPAPCQDCGTEDLSQGGGPEADLEQAKLSAIRFAGTILCKPCFASH